MFRSKPYAGRTGPISLSTPTNQPGSKILIDRAVDTKHDGGLPNSALWICSTNADNPDEGSKTENSEQLERHPKFFFDDALVVIQVGKTLFNVHKYQLAKSEVFLDMFKRAKNSDAREEDSSPEHPIKLEGVTASDFAALLTVLYARLFSSDQPAPEVSLIIPAFRVARIFKFSELCTFLLPLMEKSLNDIDKILFAKEFDIKEWLAPAYVCLCQREEPLSGEEARKLGIESVLIIWRMRERHRRPSVSPFTISHHYCYSCAGMDDADFSQMRRPENCDRCGQNIYPSGLCYTGSDKRTQDGDVIIDKAAIEIGVKKWVEDGCTVKD